jgi:hypothetical protein
MIYVVYFSDAGAPKTGLTPLVDIYKKVSDGSDGTPAPAVSETGGGFYKFTASPAEAMVVRLNGGGSLTDADKYKVMQITPHDGDLDAQVSTRAPESGGNVAAIKAKTDNLPASPAAVGSAMTLTAAYDAAKNAASENGGNVAAIKAKTDNLPGSPASETTLAAVKAKTDLIPANPAIEGNVQGHVADALSAYDPPTKAELDAAVAPLALEAGIVAHVAAALSSYDPPTRAEATADKEAVLAAVAGLNDITVGEFLSGDLSDNLNFPANSMADLVRKVFWIICNRLKITDASGAFTAYKGDGVTPAVTGAIVDNGTTTERSTPTWP